MSSFASGASSSTDARLSTRDRGAATRNVRDGTRSTLHAALVVLLDDAQQEANQVLITLAAPLRNYLGIVSKSLRGRDQTRQFYIDLAAGRWLPPLNAVVQLTQDTGVVEKMGILARPAAFFRGGASALDIYDNECKVSVIIGFASALLSCRVRRMSQYTFGLPHAAAALLSAAEDDRVE